MSIAVEDEGPHSFGAGRDWNESFYFNFFDPHSQHSGMFWMGLAQPLSPQDQAPGIGGLPKRVRGLIGLCLPNNVILADRFEQAWCDDQPLEVEHLSFTCLSPLKVWEVKYSGALNSFQAPRAYLQFYQNLERTPCINKQRCSLHLRFEALVPPIEFHHRFHRSRFPVAGLKRLFLEPVRFFGECKMIKQVWQAIQESGPTHRYEQAGLISGSLCLDDHSYAIQGVALRDHSWGIRKWGLFTSYRLINGMFGSSMMFTAAQYEVLGYLIQMGYVWDEGGYAMIVRFQLKEKAHLPGLVSPRLALTLTTDHQKTYHITGQVSSTIPYVSPEADYHLFDAFGCVAWEWNGHQGYGMAECFERVPI